jgi:hypothetical protein
MMSTLPCIVPGAGLQKVHLESNAEIRQRNILRLVWHIFTVQTELNKLCHHGL